MDSLVEIPLIIVIYVLFVLKLGPELMKKQQPFDLKTFIKFYNITQILVNSILIFMVEYANLFLVIFFLKIQANYRVGACKKKRYASIR